MAPTNAAKTLPMEIPAIASPPNLKPFLFTLLEFTSIAGLLLRIIVVGVALVGVEIVGVAHVGASIVYCA